MRQQADQMLRECRVLEILAKYGDVRLFGSYDLDLMVWPEIDIWVVNEHFQPTMAWDIVKELSQVVSPTTVFVANRIDHILRVGPNDAVLVDFRFHHRDRLWKLDLGLAACNRHAFMFETHEHLRTSLSPASRATIKAIKEVAVRSPRHMKGKWTFTSPKHCFRTLDIYLAVVRHGVRSPAEFAQFLWERRRIDVRDEFGALPGSVSGSVSP